MSTRTTAALPGIPGGGVSTRSTTELVIGRGGGAHEVSHGGSACDVRANHRFNCGAARAVTDPDLVRSEQDRICANVVLEY
jgi:hypothetical protein